MGITFLLIMPSTEEDGNQLGWLRTCVKLGSMPKNALMDQPDQAVGSALLELSSGIVLCWKIQAVR